MKSVFGNTIGEDIDYQHELNTQRWMETEDDVRFDEHHKMQNGGYIVKIENDDGKDDDLKS